ncbi:type I-E CRISPR-associated protein Cas6/Cse3/CasE [Streptomyces sp. YIM 98790]|uniref:type I-E CRISPR-associated protein Cas6/Cse3/CasE n=1 Tax=Streptomyces sp. YIM 98790 TaxID=2689077 RepID=UPI001407CFE2|nr:type I-E CRISPR-associated protein Cas6/Cse3/CasE [Streptomyces sp. YIM 98790]
MYLTRFRINTARTGARRLLASPQVLHAAVMSSFAEILPGAPGAPGAPDAPRVLWRLDRDAKAHVTLCLTSPYQPDLTHLVEQAGWPASEAPGWSTCDYAPFLHRLSSGEHWDFRLTANPVHSVRRRPGEPTRRTAHVTPAHQVSWLLRRQEAAGFRVVPAAGGDPGTPRVVVRGRRALVFSRRRNDRPVTLLTVTYDGRLEIADPDAFRRTLTHGLGRARGYGCGLMTLSPPD